MLLILGELLFNLNFYYEICREEADEYINIGTINGLFVLGRSIGFIGKKYASLTNIFF